MVRIARVVVSGIPHHITQRGNRRQETFFRDKDYDSYLNLMSEWCGKRGVEIWGYCLMPNHVHMIAVPETEEGLARAIGEAHKRYTRMINLREHWTGYLWQGRFSSFPMDEDYLLAAVRYVELNPVRARLVDRPEKWRWSSASAHLQGKDDKLVKVRPMLDRVSDWCDLLASGDEHLYEEVRKHERTGRPLGSGDFIKQVSQMLNRELEIKRSGRKKKGK
jgi:putative transposase